MDRQRGDGDDIAMSRAEFRCGRYPTTNPASTSYDCRCGKYFNEATNKYPWQVELVKDPKTAQEPICSGTLVSEMEVVTAAHCGALPWARMKNGRVPEITKVDIKDLHTGCPKKLGHSRFIAISKDVFIMQNVPPGTLWDGLSW